MMWSCAPAYWDEYCQRDRGHFDCDAISDRYFKVLKARYDLNPGSKVFELVLALPYETYDISYHHSIEDDEPEGIKW